MAPSQPRPSANGGGHDQALTANIANVQAGIGSWTALGGCDTPESQINALFQLATNASAGFRSNSTRIIAWFGDSNGHDPSFGHSLTSAINALVAAKIRVIAVPVITASGNGLDSTGQATAVANATGGVVLPSASPDQVAQAILTGLKNLPVTVTPKPTCDSGLTATYDAASKTVTSGTDAIFKETLTVAPNAVGVLKVHGRLPAERNACGWLSADGHDHRVRRDCRGELRDREQERCARDLGHVLG